jgi:hypothetical protein
MVSSIRFLLTAFLTALFINQQIILPSQAEAVSKAASCNRQSEEWRCKAKFISVCNLIAQNSVFSERLPNWHRKLAAKTELGTVSDSDIESVVSDLGDDFTYFSDASQTQIHQNNWTQHGTVKACMLPENIAYIRISTFWSENVAMELESALHMLSAAEAIVLDLRDNKGGDIYEAHKVCSMFLDKGTFTTLRGRLNGVQFEEKLEIAPTSLRTTTDGIIIKEPRTPNLTGKRPLVILVNGNTRSAAEMVAGCLQDQRRALLLGSRTYGKGVIQSTWIFDDGSSLKIAMAKHFLPSGRNIHGIGIKPDVQVDNRGSGDVQLARSVECLQRGSSGDHYVVNTAYSP